MNSREQKPAEESIEFEQALSRLEALVKEMESGTLSLDRMMRCFEEGSELARLCERKLNEVEKKVEKLLKQADASATVPFDPEADSEIG